MLKFCNIYVKSPHFSCFSQNFFFPLRSNIVYVLNLRLYNAILATFARKTYKLLPLG